MNPSGRGGLRIGAILLGAFALRAWGVGFGLPHVYHQDEPILVHHALAMGAGEWGLRFFVIPPFTQWVLLAVYGVLFLLGRLAGAWSGQEDFALQFLSDPTLFYASGRVVLGVLAGTATVWVVYRIGRRFFSEETGWLAALLLAVAPAHVQHSHYLYADAPVTLACALLVERALALIRKPTVRRYAAFGLVLGWAAAIKYTALYFAPAILFLQFAVFGENMIGKVSFKRLLYAAAACVVSFVVFAPALLLDLAGFWAQMTRQAGAEGAVGLRHHLTYSLAGGTGWIFVLLAAAGFVRTPDAGGRRKPVYCLLALFVSYYACISFFSQHFARYALPLVPLMCLAAANGWRRLRRVWRAPVWGPHLALVLMLAELAAPAVYGDWLLTQRDTRDEAKDWIERNLPAGATVAVDNRFFAPRLGMAPDPDEPVSEASDAKARLRKERRRLRSKLPEPAASYRVYTMLSAGAPEPEIPSLRPFVTADLDGMERAGVGYLILNRTDPLEAASNWPASNPDRLERVAVFTPYRDERAQKSVDPHDSTAAPHLPAELFRRKRPGPYLEVFRVRR